MTSTKRKNNEPLTSLAKKYTHPTGEDHKIIAFTGKSGMTPLPSPSALPPGLRQQHADFSDYQKNRFLAFSTKELVDLDAFAPSFAANIPDLDNPINPLFERRKWETSKELSCPEYLMPGNLGYWNAQNDVVWDLLQPSLRLASRFLDNVTIIPWSVTLIDGDYTPIETGIPDQWKGNKLLRVRKPRQRPGAPLGMRGLRRGFKKEINDLFEKVTLRIWSGHTSYTGRQWGDKNFDFARASQPRGPDTTTIQIALELLEPLLRTDLTAAERMVDIFRVAVNLLHESCHALWMLTYQKHGMQTPFPEPYFEDQCVTELGLSYTDVVFGGLPWWITGIGTGTFKHGNGLSSGGVFSSGWFNRKAVDYVQRGRTESYPGTEPFPFDWDWQDSYPIPIPYFVSLAHSDFWETHARQYPGSLKMGPRLLGVRFYLDNETFIVNSAASLAGRKDPDPDPLDISAPPNFQVDQKAEHARQLAAHKILQSFDARVTPKAQGININLIGRSSNVSSVATETSDLPPCPRYEEIKTYLIINGGDGRLCLNTMDRDMPENTLLNHILQLRQINITTEEWRVFLRTANDRGQLFSWRPDGRGVVTWLYPLPLASYRQVGYTSSISQGDLDIFRAFSLSFDWAARTFIDVELVDLYEMFLDYIMSSTTPLRLQVTEFRQLIDDHHAKMDLWCWGPNGVVRRLRTNWPNQI